MMSNLWRYKFDESCIWQHLDGEAVSHFGCHALGYQQQYQNQEK